MESPPLHWKILDKKRKNLLQQLAFLKEEGFYLAGGTGLALQLGHRKSLDFDFYKKEQFNPENLQTIIVSQFSPKLVELIQNTKGFLEVHLNDIEITFFLYPYNIIQLYEYDFGNLASIADIAAMKLIAIVQRGTKRDFIDIYCLMKEMGLKKMLEAVRKKYPGYNIYVGLQALLYFEDAEKIGNTYKNRFNPLEKSNWKEVKKYITQQVFAIQREL